MEYERCYVFQPENPRPIKKRKTENQGLHASWNLRKKAYQKAWEAQHSRIEVRVNSYPHLKAHILTHSGNSGEHTCADPR